MRPKIQKGAFVALKPDSQGKVNSQNARYLIFQYNPENLKRRLIRTENNNQKDTNIFTRLRNNLSPQNKQLHPIETIEITLEFDATDNIETPEKYPNVVEHGLHGYIATLESMITPDITDNGKIETELPLVLFHWGVNRILPVRLNEFIILEESFDQNLNPIRIKMDICMQVLNISDFEKKSIGYNIAMQNIVKKRLFTSAHALNRTSSLRQDPFR